ncbi:MAG: hypothetical protein AAFX06_29845, partial [Planctomycetota bacterium]
MIVVNSEDPATTFPDDGIISFRDAIAESNSSPEVDTIIFANTVTRLEDIGVTIRAPVVIDGTGVTIASGFLTQATIHVRNHTGTTIKNFTFVQGSDTSAAILVDGGEGHTISGNRFQGPAGSSRVGLAIEISDSNDNTIGGTDPEAGNVFTNLNVAIQVDDESEGPGSGDTKIVGNLIGVDESGTAIRNRTGIAVNDTVGTVIEGNTISANSNPILLSSSSFFAEIRGNRIGLAPLQDVAVRNFGPVLVRGASHEIDGNVISGNTFADALHIAGSDNTVTNNFIGTNSTGTEALANSVGILINPGNSPEDEAKRNTIGPGNVISGNSLAAIRIEVEELNPNIPENNTIVGNIIGLSQDKLTPIANGRGIDLDGAKSTTIGGDTAAESNVIAGNSSHGIAAEGGRIVGPDFAFVDVPTEGTIIEGNFIGVPADGAIPIPNGEDGIRFNSGVGQALIGSTTVAVGSFSNVIQGNTGHGIRITEPGDHANLGNKILGNGQQDVDTGPSGPNENDDPDVDGITNIPVITEVREGSTSATYSLVGALAGLNYIVEFFDAVTGTLLKQIDQLITSENTFTETISDGFFPNIQAVATPKNGNTLGQSSEPGKLATPPGDLQIKGSYERESNFGGDGIFEKEEPADSRLFDPSELQIELLEIPIREDDPSEKSVYRFDVLLENDSSEEQEFRLQTTEDGVNEENGSPTVQYFRRSDGADGEEITTEMGAGNAGITLDANASELFVIKITRNIGFVDFEGELIPFSPSVTITFQVFSGDNTEPDDTVVAISNSGLGVNSESDLDADPEALALGVLDIEPDVPGQQISLRSAITYTNFLPGPQDIAFQPDRPFLIEVEDEPLPEITDSLEIIGPLNEDGTKLGVEIRGSGTSGSPDGLVVNLDDPSSGRVAVSGVAITGFARHGIRSDGGSLRLLNSHLGLQGVAGDPDQVDLRGNGGYGVFTEDTNVFLSGLTIAGNGLGGVHVRNGDSSLIDESRFGVTPSGKTEVRSPGAGIEIQGNSGTATGKIDESIFGGHETGIVVRDTTAPIEILENQIGALNVTSREALADATDLSLRKFGVVLEDTTSALVTKNRITASGEEAEAGIRVVGRSSGLLIAENVVGNRFSDIPALDDAVLIVGRSIDDVAPSNAIVRNNSVQYGSKSAIAVRGAVLSDNPETPLIEFVSIESNQIGHFSEPIPLLDESVGIDIANAVTNIFIGAETAEAEKKNTIDKANIGIAVSSTGQSGDGDIIIGDNDINVVSGALNRVGIRVQDAQVDSIIGNRITDAAIGVDVQSGNVASLTKNKIDGVFNTGTGVQFVDAEFAEIAENEIVEFNNGIRLDSMRMSSDPSDPTPRVARNQVDTLGVAVEVLNNENSATRSQFHLIENTLVTDGPHPALEILAPTEGLRIERNVLTRGETTTSGRSTQSLRATVFIEPNQASSANPLPSVVQFNDVVGPAGVVLSNEAAGSVEPVGVFGNNIKLTGDFPGIPIDLHLPSDDARGITTNEEGTDAGDGPNGLQSNPSLSQPESTTFLFQGAFSFSQPQVMLVDFVLRGKPDSQFVIEFALSNPNGTVVTDGGTGTAGFDTTRNRTLITTDQTGLAAQSVRISGLDPRIGSDDALTHLAATATRVEFDSENRLSLTETSEFSQSVPINFIEANSSNDSDKDGRIDRFEDAVPGVVDASLFGDVNGDGVQDAQQQHVVAGSVDGPISVAPPGDALSRLLDDSLAASASIEALNGGQIVGSGAVKKTDSEPEEEVVGDGLLDLVVMKTDGATATFKYTRPIPFFGFHKEMRTGVFENGKEKTATQVFAPGTESFPDGISIDFFQEDSRHVAIVVIDDGSPFDLDDRPGFVADPFVVSLGDALAATTTPGGTELFVGRSGDSLQVTGENGIVVQSSVIIDTPAAALQNVSDEDGRIVVSSDPADPIVLPQGIFVIGNGANDEFFFDGVLSTLLTPENQSP